MRAFIKFSFWAFVLIWVQNGWSYPLDGYPTTGILRLEGFRLAQQGRVAGIRLPTGALLTKEQVDLRLTEYPGFQMPAVDPELSAQIESLLGEDADNYGIAVLDLTDIRAPRYAEHRGSYHANPGSVGKIVVALGIFQALADIYPDDVDKRLKVLHDAVVTADQFIQTDHHMVPWWMPDGKKISYRPIQVGDRANLWTYLDWMLSASSNAAASMVIRELMLLVQFGRDYPLSPEAAAQFFAATPREQLSQLLSRSLQEPVTRNGLDLDNLRQGSFFTWKGKQLVPGTTSHASPVELMRYLVKMEQGRLVDTFSSREIKRLLYMTQGRIRYASAPALYPAAVYFKSGSLYQCRAEPNFKCGKYQGNVVNMMNSLAIVESPAAERKIYYMVVVMSNVLRKNSAVAHQTLATRIQRLMEAYHRGR
jgi:Beta-lactamase enzyme family